MKEKDPPYLGHRQRVKDLALKSGLDGFAGHQVLELLLFYAMPYKDTKEVAYRLIQRFGTFGDVLNADYEALLQVEGVGPNTATLLTLMPEFFRRYEKDRFGAKVRLLDQATMMEYVRHLFTGCSYEAFYLIALDNSNHVLNAVKISQGSLTEVAIYPRLVVEAALNCRADSVVLAHNHPSGDMRPSAADIDLTQRICAVLEEIGISVLDHIIMCGEQCFSFVEKGFMVKQLR